MSVDKLRSLEEVKIYSLITIHHSLKNTPFTPFERIQPF